ncbi:hypothetical protein L7F22_047507 [Adiantum nelumboides]|nr:hypothetical protein [Adiantum nelumboides]
MAQWTFVKFEKLHFTLQNILQSLEDDNIIGQGGFGTVYRGVMPCGRVLAIRRIPASGESWKELDILGKVGHRHIIKLLGWCSNGHTHLLLYDYMPNGSLGQLIYGGPAALVHDAWETRFNIALGAAEGLAYLHHDCFPPILHRDVKPNNILIDSRCQAKLADFGFARPLLQGPTTPRSFSSIAGTCGYLAPGIYKYGHTLRVDDKSDVYSYGVVLLELVTGQKPLSAEFGEGMDIVKWARSMALTEENFLHMLDSILGDPENPCTPCEAAQADQVQPELNQSKGDLTSMVPEQYMQELPLHHTNFDFPTCSSFSAPAAAPPWMRLASSLSASSSSSGFAVSSSASLDRADMILVLQLALRCVADDPHMRPTMHEVVKMLKGISEQKRMMAGSHQNQ